MTDMEIAVQWVRTSWSKYSRGGPMATRRNSVPVAFPLPSITAEVSHTVPDRHQLRLDERDEMLRVFLNAHAWGMPKRWRRPPAVRLAPGEWMLREPTRVVDERGHLR